MKKILFVIAFVLFVGIPTTIHATTPACSTTENGIPENIGDPACYTSTSTTSSWSTQEFDYYECVWVDTGCDYCKETNGSGQYRTCSGSCPAGWYMYWAPVVSNTCTGDTTCGNMNGTHVGEGWNPVYKTVWHSDTTTTNTCHYLTVDTWSECDTVTGTQVATNVTQHSISGTDCDNLNEDTTRICGVCDTKTDGKGSGTAPGPEEDLCLHGTPYPVPPTLNTTTNMWEWSCLGDDGTSYVDDVVCSAPRNESGECSTTAGGEYAWDETNFRGELCSGGTVMDPAPNFPEYNETVTWGCNQIGDPAVTTSTTSDACSAIRNAPQPGICDSASNDGLYLNPPTDLCYDPDYLNEPRIVNNNFADPNPLVGPGPWSWTCNGSNATVDSVQCSAKCKPEITIDAEDRTFVVGEGETEVTINIHYNSIDCTDTYSCTIDGNAITFDGDGNSSETFTYTGPNPIIECTDGNVIITPDPGQTVLTAYCTEKSCNAQGTCQAMPKTGVTSSKQCSSTCNSNADCSSGRMIETKP